METFKALVTEVQDLSHKDESGHKRKAAGFRMRSFGPFPDVDTLVGKTVEIRVLDEALSTEAEHLINLVE